MAGNQNPFGFNLYGAGTTPTAGTTSGLDGFMKMYQDAMGSGGGLFGLGDVATGGLLGAGTSLLGGLAGLLGGPSEGEKRQRKVFGLAQNRLGQDVLRPEQYMADYMRASAPRFNQQAETMNRRLNLDSGVAQGELQHSMQSDFAQFMLNAKMQNDQLKTQRDSMLLQLMGSLGGA